MATTTFTHVGTLTSIAPGATTHWWWNNAPDERVWSFSVDPEIPPLGAFPSSAKLEITRVEYRQNLVGSTFEREIHFWVKNTGTITANYEVHMATVRE